MKVNSERSENNERWQREMKKKIAEHDEKREYHNMVIELRHRQRTKNETNESQWTKNLLCVNWQKVILFILLTEVLRFCFARWDSLNSLFPMLCLVAGVFVTKQIFKGHCDFSKIFINCRRQRFIFSKKSTLNTLWELLYRNGLFVDSIFHHPSILIDCRTNQNNRIET